MQSSAAPATRRVVPAMALAAVIAFGFYLLPAAAFWPMLSKSTGTEVTDMLLSAVRFPLRTGNLKLVAMLVAVLTALCALLAPFLAGPLLEASGDRWTLHPQAKTALAKAGAWSGFLTGLWLILSALAWVPALAFLRAWQEGEATLRQISILLLPVTALAVFFATVLLRLFLGKLLVSAAVSATVRPLGTEDGPAVAGQTKMELTLLLMTAGYLVAAVWSGNHGPGALRGIFTVIYGAGLMLWIQKLSAFWHQLKS